MKSTEASSEEKTKKPEPKKAGTIDFSKIAQKREEAHGLYKASHFDEEHPKDIHGGRFTYDGAHIDEDSRVDEHAAYHERMRHGRGGE